MLPHHRQELKDSGISDQIIDRNFASLTDPRDIDQFLNRNTDSRWKHGQFTCGWKVAGLEPLTGEYRGIGGQFKSDQPRTNQDGKAVKYESIASLEAVPLFLDTGDRYYWQSVINSPLTPIVITEGAKKAGCVLSQEVACVSISGVTNGQKQGELRDDIKLFCREGRTVYLGFDSDMHSKPQVAQALDKLARLLCAEGCVVKVLMWSEEVKGIDDYLVSTGDTVQNLMAKAWTIEKWRSQFVKFEQKPSVTASTLIPQIADILENSSNPIDADICLSELAQKTRIAKKDLYAYYRQYRELSNDTPVQTMAEFLKAETASRWLIAGLLPEGTTALVHANAGVGKSLLAYDLAKAVASGTDWNGLPTQQGNVLIAQSDEPSCITRERFREMGYHELPEGSVFYLESWNFQQLPKLEKLVSENQIKFVIIDSLTSANRSATSEEKDSPYAHALYDLRDLCNRYGCTGLVIHHSNRQGGLRGSSAIDASVSEIWKLRLGTEAENLTPNQRILEIGKSRAGLSGTYLLECDFDEGYRWQWHGEFVRGQENQPKGNGILEYIKQYPDAWIGSDELSGQGYCSGDLKLLGTALYRLWRRGLLARKQAESAPTKQGGRKPYLYRLAGFHHSNNDVENPDENLEPAPREDSTGFHHSTAIQKGGEGIP